MCNEKIIENYIPFFDDFCFDFNKDTCHFVDKGICPGETNKEKLLSQVEYETSCKCESLMQKIIANGFYEHDRSWRIMVVKQSCGKYVFDNGRHRTCAASKLNVPIKIHITEDESASCMCKDKNNNIEVEDS